MANEQRPARLSIDVPQDARRRIDIGAAQRDQSIREYLWEAIETLLKADICDGPAHEGLSADRTGRSSTCSSLLQP